jgi:hypothetical protein
MPQAHNQVQKNQQHTAVLRTFWPFPHSRNSAWDMVVYKEKHVCAYAAPTACHKIRKETQNSGSSFRYDNDMCMAKETKSWSMGMRSVSHGTVG